MDIVKYLIEQCRVDPNQVNIYGDSALLGSAAGGNLDVVKYLIEECRVDPN